MGGLPEMVAPEPSLLIPLPPAPADDLMDCTLQLPPDDRAVNTSAGRGGAPRLNRGLGPTDATMLVIGSTVSLRPLVPPS